MNKKLGAFALLGASAVVLAGCSGGAGGTSDGTDTSGFDPEGAKDQDITFWVMGGDTPADAPRLPRRREYEDATGGTLTIEEQTWGDALTKLANQLPDANNTPDVTEIGNTWAPTFTDGRRFQRPQRHLRRPRRRRPAPVVRRGRLGRRRAVRRCRTTSARATSPTARTSGRPPACRCPPRSRSSTTLGQVAEDRRPGRLLHRRPGLAQRHLVDLRQRRRPRQEGRRHVGLDALRPEEHRRASSSSRICS